MDMEDVIMKHVLRFVPAKSLCRFKSVCKTWNQWISSPFLAHQQATHFTKTSGFFSQSSNNRQHPSFFIPLDHPSHGVPFPSLSFLPEQPTSLRVRASSNGLLLCCQTTFHDTTYFICNPTTMEWTHLPEPTLFHGPASAISLSFTPSTYNFQSHFQIVCAVPDPFHSVKTLYFEIYSSRTNSWRVVESLYFYDHDDFMFKGDGFCIDGSFVYWEASNGVALGFDLAYEEHGEIELPRHGEGALTEIRGELCYVVAMTWNDVDDDEAGAEGYSLGVFGGHDMGLKLRVPLEIGDFLGEDFDGEVRVLSCVSDGLVMILVGSNVVLYDMEKREGKVVRRLVDTAERVGDGVGWFLPYVNSLVRVCPVEKMPPEDRDYDEVLRNRALVEKR